jgi:hypothetical protein
VKLENYTHRSRVELVSTAIAAHHSISLRNQLTPVPPRRRHVIPEITACKVILDGNLLITASFPPANATLGPSNPISLLRRQTFAGREEAYVRRFKLTKVRGARQDSPKIPSASQIRDGNGAESVFRCY